jgi:hypothetical protein
MKKVFLLIVCMTMCGAALFAQAGWPDIEKYAELLMSKFVDAGTDWKRARMEATNPEVAEKYASLQGNAEYFDEALELGLYTFYYVFSRNPAYSVPPEAEAILPRNNPRLVDRQLGAMVCKELAVTRFLGNSAATARWEAVLKTITDRGNVTRAEVETFYRQNIGALIAAAVDTEFGKVSFLLDKTEQVSYNAMLARDVKNQYILSYDGYFNGTRLTKTLSATSLETLLVEMRKNTTDFSQTSINQVNTQAALIPVVSFEHNRKDPRGDIATILYEFYVNPNNATVYEAVRDVNVFYNVSSVIAYKSENRRTYERLSRSYRWVLERLSERLAQKVIRDSDGRTSVTLPADVRSRLELVALQ